MRFLGYLWAFPMTLVGLFLGLAALFSGGSAKCRDGVLEVSGGIMSRLLRGNRLSRGGAAMTLGHVILARDAECLERSRLHELHHVRQFERWGLFLLPAYWIIGAWLRLRGYDPYLDNPFEPPA